MAGIEAKVAKRQPEDHARRYESSRTSSSGIVVASDRHLMPSLPQILFGKGHISSLQHMRCSSRPLRGGFFQGFIFCQHRSSELEIGNRILYPLPRWRRFRSRYFHSIGRFSQMPVRLVSQEELPGPLAGYRLIERLGRGGFGEVWKVEAPGGFLKAAKFVFGDLEAMDEESRPAEQELKALRPRQRHPPPLHPVARTIRHHRRPAHHRHGAGRPQSLGPLPRVPRPGAAGHPARRAAPLHGGDGRSARPDEQRSTRSSTSTSSRRTCSWSPTTSRSPTSAWPRTARGRPRRRSPAG